MLLIYMGSTGGSGGGGRGCRCAKTEDASKRTVSTTFRTCLIGDHTGARSVLPQPTKGRSCHAISLSRPEPSRMAPPGRAARPDLLRVSLTGSSVPASVRPGFRRSWSCQIVSDMWEAYPTSCVRLTLVVHPEAFMSHITAELTSLRLSLSVAHDLPNFVTFEVRIDASVPGCAVLPLWLGPIAVTQRLPQPVGVLVNHWSTAPVC